MKAPIFIPTSERFMDPKVHWVLCGLIESHPQRLDLTVLSKAVLARLFITKMKLIQCLIALSVFLFPIAAFLSGSGAAMSSRSGPLIFINLRHLRFTRCSWAIISL